jgi:hypothetical protein
LLSSRRAPRTIGDVAFGDRDIRTALRAKLAHEHRDQPDTVFFDELGVCRGRVRIDLAVVNGLLHGYEIKSDRDSLRRLAGQVDQYSRVLDRATLVVGERYLGETFKLLPAWWEVLLVSRGPTGAHFSRVRAGEANPRRDARSLVELLWLEKALALLEQRCAARGLRGKPRRVVWDRVCQLYDVDEIATCVREHLKARSTHSIAQQP